MFLKLELDSEAIHQEKYSFLLMSELMTVLNVFVLPVASLPKAFTSWKLSQVVEFIWTMTYLPAIACPGMLITLSLIDMATNFTAAFDLI